MHEYFNIHKLTKKKSDADLAMTRILDELTEAVNDKKNRLPKYLIVIIDKDLLKDVPDVFNAEAPTVVQELTESLVRQITTTIRRKHESMLEKRPGSIASIDTKIIFVCMLRRAGSFNTESTLGELLSLRPKFNDSLNDMTAKMGQHMLTINSCHSYEHFNKHALLSVWGKQEFWAELDELIEKFHIDKIKLLPNPKNPPRRKQNTATQLP